MQPLKKSIKLDKVCYDIRGPVLEHARQMEEDGHRIIKLNIGNPSVFNFDVPEEIRQDVIRNISKSGGYTDSKGLFEPRKAIVHYTQRQRVAGVRVDDVILGNGVSELIVMAMQALLNNGDEVLVPMPDYPLWTAATTLAGGVPQHYVCDEENEWLPDLEDIESKVTEKTRAIVVINPNNPTGALYPKETLEGLIEIARQHELVIMADEIYDQVLFDGNEHISMASLAEDVFFLTFNGLSKNHRACGYRAGWMITSGDKSHAKDFIEGLDILASMRLCSNVPGQLAIQTALGGYQSIDDLVAPDGRICQQRDIAYEMLTAIPGLSCMKPKAAMYLFFTLDPEIYPIEDDQQFVLDLLLAEKVLIVQGSGFNCQTPNHFRVVFLPIADELKDAMKRIDRFLKKYREKFGAKV